MTAADPIPPLVRSEIEARLARVEAKEKVRLLLAVESGSRAWGFPSPDSDYDVRFVYVRPRDWYLSLTPGRDVIEAPIMDEIDLNGWDIRKFLGLLVKSNAVVSEWLLSPIRYRPDDPVVAVLARLADDACDPNALAHHYRNLGRNNAERWLDADGDVAVKKYFYALRPALALRCLRRDPAVRPPMNLQALVEAAALPAQLAADIATLVAAKSRTNERGNATRLPALDALIRTELAEPVAFPPAGLSAAAARRADDLFLGLANA